MTEYWNDIHNKHIFDSKRLHNSFEHFLRLNYDDDVNKIEKCKYMFRRFPFSYPFSAAFLVRPITLSIHF